MVCNGGLRRGHGIHRGSMRESHTVWPVSLTSLARQGSCAHVLLRDQYFSPFTAG